jgi:hypothetical protein
VRFTWYNNTEFPSVWGPLKQNIFLRSTSNFKARITRGQLSDSKLLTVLHLLKRISSTTISSLVCIPSWCRVFGRRSRSVDATCELDLLWKGSATQSLQSEENWLYITEMAQNEHGTMYALRVTNAATIAMNIVAKPKDTAMVSLVETR